MSKITNEGLTRYGTGCFRPIAVPIWQQWASKGSVVTVNFSVLHVLVTAELYCVVYITYRALVCLEFQLIAASFCYVCAVFSSFFVRRSIVL